MTLHPHPDRPDNRRRQKGVALIAVIWAMALLSIIAASFTLQNRTQINLARNALDNAKARAHADAGIHLAILELLAPAPDISLPVNGTPVERSYKGSRLTLRVQDHGGLIDLNRGRPEQLSALFIAAGLDRNEAAALADAIADYRDTDSLRRLNGVEDEDYRRAGLAFGAADQPFATVDELRRVMGMTEVIYDAVKDAVTIHSRHRAPDMTTAPALVRAAMRGDAGDQSPFNSLLNTPGRNKMTPRELQEQGLTVPEDSDQPGAEELFAQPLTQGQREIGGSEFPTGTVIPSTSGNLPPRRAARFNTAYGLRAVAVTDTGAVFVREAVVRFSRLRGGAPYTVLDWHQGEAPSPIPRTNLEGR